MTRAISVSRLTCIKSSLQRRLCVRQVMRIWQARCGITAYCSRVSVPTLWNPPNTSPFSPSLPLTHSPPSLFQYVNSRFSTLLVFLPLQNVRVTMVARTRALSAYQSGKTRVKCPRREYSLDVTPLPTAPLSRVLHFSSLHSSSVREDETKRRSP